VERPYIPSSIDEIFGYAVPGYLWAFFIVIWLWYLNLIRSSIYLAVAFGFLGLPVGYFWTYAFYSPTIWKYSSGTWDDFAHWMGKRLTKGVSPVANMEEAKMVTNRAYSYLRWSNPSVGQSLAFFHARHHILRSSGFILFLSALPTAVLVGRAANPPDFTWALAIFASGLIGAILMLSAAQTELATLIDHCTFVAANEAALPKWSREFLELMRKRPQIIFRRTVLKIVVAASILFFYGAIVFLLSLTNWCASCAASQLWKYSVIACLPSWLVFLLCATWKRDPLTSRPCISVLIGFGVVLIVTAWLAPLFTFLAFNQVYDIVYFNSISFSFASGMTILLAVTLGLMSSNLGIAFPRGQSRDDKSPACWKPVATNFSLIGWIVVLIQHLGIANQLAAFGVLLISTTSIPLFMQLQPMFERATPRVRKISQLVGLGSLATVLGGLDFATGFPLWHPFLVVALTSSIAICLSSPLGQTWSRYAGVDGILTKKRLQYVLAFIAVVWVLISWEYSRAAIAVIIPEVVHVQ
jgi:hypothetical protein